jgi:hypothetical protein
MPVPKLDGHLELTIARCLTAELEEYLKSVIVYWPVASSNPFGDKMPPLTIGNVLDAIGRAAAALNDLTPDQAAELTAIRQQHDRIRDARPAVYASKAAREIGSRLDAWSQYLDEAARQSADVAAYYPHEVRVRAKAHVLAQALGRDLPQAAQQRLALSDARLRALFEPGAFVWDDRLQAAFPQNPCWWLYGHLPD